MLEADLQPPSGGCVLKHAVYRLAYRLSSAAAFGRLCVETGEKTMAQLNFNAAAFGRLCVETPRR